MAYLASCTHQLKFLKMPLDIIPALEEMVLHFAKRNSESSELPYLSLKNDPVFHIS